MKAGRWLGAMVLAAGLGWLVSALSGVHDVAGSAGYQLFTTALLAIGLYGSAAGISIDSARRSLGAIVFATTIGVLVKAVLISGAMYLAVGSDARPFALLGIVVAQIDPLSVAAMIHRSDMSDRAKTILLAWSSFDDPITTLMTIYAVSWLGLHATGSRSVGASPLEYAGGLGVNLAFAAIAGLLWLALRAGALKARALMPWLPARSGRVVTLATLAGLLAVAVGNVLMLGVAVMGLFFRPKLDAALPRVLNGALLVATFALGALLTEGISLAMGAWLAVFAFVAQAVAAAILPARLSANDRLILALGQQNGITAIILALAIEPVLPGTVAIVAPAILGINLLHLVTNSSRLTVLKRATRPAPSRPAITRPVPRNQPAR